jgi:carbonic anhydrase
MSISPSNLIRAHRLAATAAAFWMLTFVSATSIIANARETAVAMPPGKALQMLLDGNRRYATNRAEHRNQRPSESPQHPLAIILSCSDSRVPPEIIFDQGIGDLFVVRVAGNTYDRLGLDSIKYAVIHLGTTLIMVIGHDQCGAVTAALKSYPDPQAAPMLTNIYGAVREARGQPGNELSNAIDDNAILIAGRLTREPDLQEKIKSGQLKIEAARYILKTGAVKLLK